jgi:Domain of unknown function (DUF4398)
MRTTGTRCLTSAALATLALAAACQSLPSNSPMLEKARADYRAAEEDPHVREFAKRELRQASDAMFEADRAWARAEDADEIEHLAYMAKQRIAIAQEVAVGRRAEATRVQPAFAR